MRSTLVAVTILMAVLISGNIRAESGHTHSPNSRKIQNNDTANEQQGTTPDHRATEQYPLVVKILQTPKSSEQTREDSRDRHEKTVINFLTIGTAVVTAVILLFQLFVFRKQARRLKETIDEMKVATKASQEAANAAKEQTTVAIKEFIFTHRPRLVVRNVSVKPYTDPAIPFEEGKPIQIEWVVVNTGNTPAEITESNATILVDGPSFHARTPYSPERDHMNGVKLVPGGAFTFTMQSEQVDLKNNPALISINRGEKVEYFFGFIMYRDDIGNVRRTAFCRRYAPDTERFILAGDPDYEYTD